MKNTLIVLAAVLVLGQAGVLFAGETALSQLPALDLGQEQAVTPSPVKPAMTRVNFRTDHHSNAGFSLSEPALGIQVNGYKDSDGNLRFSGVVGGGGFASDLIRNYNEQIFRYKAENVALVVAHYGLHYKVTGSVAGANGAATPVNLLIRGALRDRRFSVSETGLELSAPPSAQYITGAVDAAVYDLKLTAALANIMAALQSQVILGVLDEAYNSPDPFFQDSGTTITYVLLQPVDQVKITIYNATGKVLKEMSGNTAKGTDSVFWYGHSPYDGVEGRKTFFCQFEISLRGGTTKVLKQFAMDAWK